jgi:pimeloyl-ACP methyl ester carboxylesterase
MHARVAGDAVSAKHIVLIHWTPLSSRMFEPLAAELAGRGWFVFAPDLLGYGRSDRRLDSWSIEQWADEVTAAATSAGLRTPVVLGGHVGALVALECALRHQDCTRAAILDGLPLPTPELQAAFSALSRASRPAPTADGAHERLAWQQAVGLWRHYVPEFELDARSIEQIWPVMIDYLSSNFVTSGALSAAHPTAERLRALKLPTVLITAERDSQSATFDAARAAAPRAVAHKFAGSHPIHDVARAAEYADAVERLLAATGLAL